MASKSKDNSKETFIIYQDWANFYFALPDAQKIDFMNAVLSKGCGKDYEIQNAVVQAYFDGVVGPDMDTNKANRERNSEQQAEKGRKSAEARKNRGKQTDTDASNGQPQSTTVNHGQPQSTIYVDVDGDVDVDVNADRDVNASPTEKEGLHPTDVSPRKSAPRGARTQGEILDSLLPDYEMSGVIEDKVREWLTYKTERREPYKPMGLKTLLSKIVRACNDYGDEAVMDMLDNAMSSGYKGPVWDRLDKPRKTYIDAIEHRLDGISAWVQKGES